MRKQTNNQKTYQYNYQNNLERISMECFNEYGYNFERQTTNLNIDNMACKSGPNCLQGRVFKEKG